MGSVGGNHDNLSGGKAFPVFPVQGVEPGTRAAIHKYRSGTALGPLHEMAAGFGKVANIGNQKKLKEIVFKEAILGLAGKHKKILVLKAIRLVYAFHPPILSPPKPKSNKKWKIIHLLVQNGAWRLCLNACMHRSL
jgi:hypothetical protein